MFQLNIISFSVLQDWYRLENIGHETINEHLYTKLDHMV